MVHTNHAFNTNLQLGQHALAQGDASTAYRHWRICIDALPSDLNDIRRLVHAFKSIGHLSDAENLLQRAYQKLGHHPLLKSDEAAIALDQGQASVAAELYCQLAKESESRQEFSQALSFLSNALMALEYTDQRSPEQKKALAEHWGALATEWVNALVATESIPAWTPKPEATEPMRIGFLSGDLCDHPVGFLLLPLLKHQTPEAWSPYIYDNGSRQDNTNRQLRSCIPYEQWRSIGNLSDADAMHTILNDHLDILIDLSGHTGKTRLRLMAHRLALKQFSWLGYSGTTGLATINGIILDDTLAQNTQPQFCEPILQLHHSRFCFRPPFAPPLQPPPSLNNGFITFGCFNNTAKYNPDLLATWIQILQRVPHSRLILKWRTFIDPAFKNNILTHFSQHGIAPDRIELRGFSTHRAMLDEYNDIDIVLDTFPFNGGYSSLETLWMGIPIITLAGETPISRQTASFLNTLNKDEWVTKDHVEYANAAVKVAQETKKLVDTRPALRYQIMDSTLFNADQFAEAFKNLIAPNLCANQPTHP